jgi:hypothetical protein
MEAMRQFYVYNGEGHLEEGDLGCRLTRPGAAHRAFLEGA